MKSLFLFLVLLLTVSMSTIGSPVPDHPSPEITVTDQTNVVVELATVNLIQLQIFDQNSILFTTSSDLETHFKDNCSSLWDNIALAKDSRVRDPKFILEKDIKTVDRYNLPIWEYEPSIEPPLSFRS